MVDSDRNIFICNRLLNKMIIINYKTSLNAFKYSFFSSSKYI